PDESNSALVLISARQALPKNWRELLSSDFQNVPLEKLLEEVPEDQFDGQPLRFRRTKDGIVIYSVGPNKNYQGDALDRLEEFDENFIRVDFRLWDVERRRQPPLPPRPKAKEDANGK
ncbi:MAG: hypothetical protein L0215_13025, partial [Gemmataceae bacterium]|nr:hypothetical protein [Gemmataceae bacterium]